MTAGSSPVVTGAVFSLIHVPELVPYGSEVRRNLEDGSLSEAVLRQSTRSYLAAVSYPPNQACIGNLAPENLASIPRPWYENPLQGCSELGPFGEVLSQELFYLLMHTADVFDLVWLEERFLEETRPQAARHPILASILLDKMRDGKPAIGICARLEKGHAVPLTHQGRVVGCVLSAEERDPTLDAGIILENLACKASGVFALAQVLRQAKTPAAGVDYVWECSEEAVGDRQQRGGGSLGKAVAEGAGCVNATGADLRAFCAAPVHAIVQAVAAVEAGLHNVVAVVGGGSVPKLGMNSRSHLARGMPILEDCLAATAVLITKDDGISPRVRLDAVGRTEVGAGSSPQTVVARLVVDPLTGLGRTLCDVDKYAVELQNPEITMPAGAGDVPRNNYKLIAALAARRGEISRDQIDEFVSQRGMPGFAPTQGHCPAGVPFLGHARERILRGELRSVMVIGKGSLFLGRMTNLADGLSFLLEQNPQAKDVPTFSGTASVPKVLSAPNGVRLAVVLTDMETETAEIAHGINQARAELEGRAELLVIGRRSDSFLPDIDVGGDTVLAHRRMEELLSSSEVAGVLTTHYSFPAGVATVAPGRTPGGQEIWLATTTGTSALDRTAALVWNTIYGDAVARAVGLAAPRAGLLNLDGAERALRWLRALIDNGYPLQLASSRRQDKTLLLRGNDVLQGSADVIVCDSLSGNLIIKLLACFNTGGRKEVDGYGYGAGVGPGMKGIVYIVSRASGGAVIGAAVSQLLRLVQHQAHRVVEDAIARANQAGIHELLASTSPAAAGAPSRLPVPAPVLDAEIPGIDSLDIEAALGVLNRAGIAAAPAMGCTGPILQVAATDKHAARRALIAGGYLAAIEE